MIRYFIPFTLLCATLAFASCGDNEDNDIDVPTEEVVPGTNHNVLVAYFSEPLPDGVDASTSASRVIVNGDLYGSVEYMAMVISEATGADVVRIQTATPYPGNFDDLASQADNERQNDIRPALATEIENFDDLAMYSFFDEYDFTGKTLIPFSSHGGSGWSGTVDDIAGMEPNATMVDGYSISRNSVAGSADGIREWLGRIGMSEQ